MDEGIKCCNKGLKLDPSNAILWHNRGYAFSLKKKFKDAIKNYNQSLRLRPNHLGTLYNKALAHSTLKHWKEVVESYDEILKLEPDRFEYWVNKGVALRMMKKYSDVIPSYEQAVKLNPEVISIWWDKAYVHYALEQYDEADKCYNEILERDPSHVNALDWKGIITGIKGDYKASISYFDKALTIEPQNKRILKNKEFVLKKLSNLNSTWQRHQEAGEIHKGEGSAMIKKSNCYCILFGETFKSPSSKK